MPYCLIILNKSSNPHSELFISKNFSHFRIEMKMLDIQERKKNLISGAFRQTEAERRQQRLRDIRDLFGINDQQN